MLPHVTGPPPRRAGARPIKYSGADQGDRVPVVAGSGVSVNVETKQVADR
jgi:hypothetical protein